MVSSFEQMIGDCLTPQKNAILLEKRRRKEKGRPFSSFLCETPRGHIHTPFQKIVSKPFCKIQSVIALCIIYQADGYTPRLNPPPCVLETF